MGRPSLYRDEFAQQAEALCKLGATDKELAAFFEVNEATVNRWKQDHPAFCESLKKGKLHADANVAERLYQRAMGYSHPEVHVSNYQGEITLTPLTKHYAPDTVAAIFWLKNRRPDQWRDKTEREVTVKYEEMSDAELTRAIEETERAIAAAQSGPAGTAPRASEAPPAEEV